MAKATATEPPCSSSRRAGRATPAAHRGRTGVHKVMADRVTATSKSWVRRRHGSWSSRSGSSELDQPGRAGAVACAAPSGIDTHSRARRGVWGGGRRPVSPMGSLPPSSAPPRALPVSDVMRSRRWYATAAWNLTASRKEARSSGGVGGRNGWSLSAVPTPGACRRIAGFCLLASARRPTTCAMWRPPRRTRCTLAPAEGHLGWSSRSRSTASSSAPTPSSRPPTRRNLVLMRQKSMRQLTFGAVVGVEDAPELPRADALCDRSPWRRAISMPRRRRSAPLPARSRSVTSSWPTSSRWRPTSACGPAIAPSSRSRSAAVCATDAGGDLRSCTTAGGRRAWDGTAPRRGGA